MKFSSKWQFWVFVAFLCKGLIFIFLLQKHSINTIPGFWGETGGDSATYLNPIDNLLAHGSYNSFRMPGYGIIYLPFLYFFKKNVACNILIILQFILSALTVYPLALIAKYVFKSATIFYVTFILYVINIYPNLYDAYIATESFTVSFLILSIFFFIKALQHEKRIEFHLFLSGLFITEVIFLRPVFFPVLILLLLILYFFTKQALKKLGIKLLILAAPFLFADGIWTARNYAEQKKIIPLTSVYSPELEKSYVGPLITLVTSWGGSSIWWDNKTELRWFGLKTKISDNDSLSDASIRLPDYIYTSKFNYDSLVKLKNEIQFINQTKDSAKGLQYTNDVQKKCRMYAQSIKNEKFFLYYFKAPIIILKKFIINSGAYSIYNKPFENLSILQRFIKIFYVILYYIIVLLGFTGMIMLISLYKKPPLLAWLLVLVVLYTIVIHVYWFRFSENRYLMPAYPYLLICAAYLMNRMLPRKMEKLQE